MSGSQKIVRPAAYAWIVQNDMVLLCRLCEDHNVGQWTLPGGGLDFGENTEAGCRREVFEETGLEVKLTRLLAVDTVCGPSKKGEMYSIRIIYQAEADSNELVAEVGGSTDLPEWVPLDSIGEKNAVELVQTALAAWKADGKLLSLAGAES
jgi:ADP-ribose pyrophosphatase YjhB (NUDIX family)